MTSPIINIRTLVTASVALAAVMLFDLSPASAVTPAILIGPDLKPREVKLQALGGVKMTYFDAERTMQVEPVGSVLQIRFIEPEREPMPPLPRETPAAAATTDDERLLKGFIEAPELDLTPPRRTTYQPRGELITGVGKLAETYPFARIELVDGQRIAGALLGSDESGENLRLGHERLGEVAVKLDQIARLNFDGIPRSDATPTTDRVSLTNGDTLEGFIVSVKSTGIEIQQGSAKPFTLPLARVNALLLANPVQRRADKQHMVWLRDGSRLLASEVSISADKLTLVSPLRGKQAATVPLGDVARIELASLEGRLIDLADLPMKVAGGGKVFGLALPPRIEGGVIRMHAPVTVEFTLPDNARRIAALAELDAEGEDASPAEFIVSLRAAGETAARLAITASQPRAALNAAVTGKTLTITLDPAGNGPVMDRLRLRDAILFVESR